MEETTSTLDFSLASYHQNTSMNKRILIFSAAVLLLASCGGETKKTVEAEDSKHTNDEMVVD